MPTAKKPKKALIQFAVAGVVALVLGVSAIGLTFMVITSMGQNKQAEIEKVKMEAKKLEAEKRRLEALANQKKQEVTITEVRAAIDIPPGATISKSMVTEEKVSDGKLTPGGFDKSTLVIGKVTNNKIMAGQPITQGHLLEGDGGVQIKDGMRAMSIQVEPTNGLNGALTIGSYVDVLTTISTEQEKITKTILQGAQVIAVGNGGVGGGPRMPSSQQAPSSVTLAVTPVQAEMLALASQQGKFYLTLRNYNDRAVANVSGVDVGSLVSGVNKAQFNFPLPPPPARGHKGAGNHETPVAFNPGGAGDDLPIPEPPAPATKTFKIEIFKGASSEAKTFEMSGGAGSP